MIEGTEYYYLRIANQRRAEKCRNCLESGKGAYRLPWYVRAGDTVFCIDTNSFEVVDRVVKRRSRFNGSWFWTYDLANGKSEIYFGKTGSLPPQRPLVLKRR